MTHRLLLAVSAAAVLAAGSAVAQTSSTSPSSTTTSPSETSGTSSSGHPSRSDEARSAACEDKPAGTSKEAASGDDQPMGSRSAEARAAAVPCPEPRARTIIPGEDKPR